MPGMTPSAPEPPPSPAGSPRETLLEINLVRAWWILVISTTFTVLFTLSGRLTGTSQAFSTVQIFDYALSALFVILLWQARWGSCPAGLRRALPSFYAVFFVLINDGYYFSAWPVAGDNVGYAFGVLTPAAMMYLRPAWFIPFLGANHVFVITLLLLKQPAPPFEALVSAIYGTTITMAIAAISSVIQYRTKIAELEKTALVARRNRELAESNSSLLAMSQNMDEAMALAAHDLRGPLLSLVSLCELERGQAGGKNGGRELFLSSVQESARGMATLVNRMVADYSSRDSALKGLALAPCDAAAILLGALRQAEPAARRKNINLQRSEFPPSAAVEANPEALERIFGNLLSNAVKFSQPFTTIKARVRRAGEDWQCEIEDEGPGIPPGDQASLFRKLQRGANQPTAGEESSGLGLYNARKLVESMNGTIEFEPAPRRGAIFRVMLKAA